MVQWGWYGVGSAPGISPNPSILLLFVRVSPSEKECFLRHTDNSVLTDGITSVKQRYLQFHFLKHAENGRGSTLEFPPANTARELPLE